MATPTPPPEPAADAPRTPAAAAAPDRAAADPPTPGGAPPGSTGAAGPRPPPLPALPALPKGGPLRALAQLLAPVLSVVAMLAVVGGLLVAGSLWLLRSEEGTAWLLARVPWLTVERVRGALLSDRFAIGRVVVAWGGGRQSVTIDELQADGVRWSWHPQPGAWIGLEAASLRARQVTIDTGPRGPRPVVMPRSLQLPLRLEAARVEVGTLQIDQRITMHRIDGRGVRLWEPGGREYHADAVVLDWGLARAEGSVSFGGLPPYTLQAQARFTSRGDGTPWTADARAMGPIAAFELSATLRGTPVRGAAAAALDVAATIHALQAWPVGTLRLRTQSLDLASLVAGAPRTALAGRADIDSRSVDGPLAASVEIDNAAPGRWNEGRLPVRRLAARLRSPDADRNRLVADEFDLLLGRDGEDAGRWRGSGEWSGQRVAIDSRIEALRPKAIDSRLAAMQLDGPVRLLVGGLHGPAPGAAAATRPAAPPAVSAEIKTTLDGRLDGSANAVRLTVDASADAQRVELRELRAEAGPARAVLAANARRLAGGSWQLRSSGQLGDFDPLPWWPGHEGSPWRAGPHRLSGGWALDVVLPPWRSGDAALGWLQGVLGTGTLRIDRSLLAGVPLSAQLQLGHRPDAVATPGSVQGEAVIGGNRIAVKGQGDPLGSGQADLLRFELQAGDLATLAPLARLLPDLEAWVPRGGRAEASVDLEGRWPDIRSEGQASVQSLQIGSLATRRASAHWRLDTASDRPLMVQAEAQGIVQGRQRLERLEAGLRGTWLQHRIELNAALPMTPPPALAAALGLRTAAGTWAQLRGDGRWSADGRGGGRWTGRVEELRLGPWSEGAGPGADDPASRWLLARELSAEVQFDAREGLAEVRAGAGQVRVGDSITLRWDDARADLRGPSSAFSLRADVEPFALAPLLARAQPDLGWQGDLMLGARVKLDVGEQVDAEMVFERRSGDLRLSDDNVSSQPFGLTDVRVAATAGGGVWQLGASFFGQTLGEATARLALRTAAGQRWPDEKTPIDGAIQARVASLGIWGTWVPPGWRLSGRLDTTARIGGTLGAPDYDGEIRASDVAVRNLLLGVDVRQGDALLRLSGARAQIEHFTLRGGDGSLRVSGHAELAGRPSVTLEMQADRFRALGRVDRQLIASGSVSLGLSTERLRAEGRVRIDEGLFDLSRSDAPALDDDVSVRQDRRVTVDPQAAAPSTRSRLAQQVAIEVDLGERIRVRGRGVDTTLGGSLRLGTSARRLTVHGIVNAAGGSYAAYGQKLDIERGLIVFGGDVENPSLDVLAIRPNIDLQVGVAISGTLQAPRVRLYAGSDMSESDKLSWLVLGRPAEGLGRADTALLQRAAVALLAGEGEAPTDALLRNLGIDQLSLRQSDTDVRETVITLGKQLSRRWYVGYERGVNATAGTFQLIYRIAQRFTLRAQSGLENSLDLIWVWRPGFEPDGPPR